MTDATQNVLHVSAYRLATDNKPPWCELLGLGVMRIPANAVFTPHSHDFAEYFLIYQGKGKVRVGDTDYYVQAGDVVCTPPGLIHDILETYEELEAFYLQEGVSGAHETEKVKLEGHIIPRVPIPVDFPDSSRAGVFDS